MGANNVPFITNFKRFRSWVKQISLIKFYQIIFKIETYSLIRRLQGQMDGHSLKDPANVSVWYKLKWVLEQYLQI